MTDLRSLAERLTAATLEPEHRETLKFRFYRGEGWVSSTTSEANVQLMCDMFNARKEIAAAILK